jgi:hypothetical protein
MGHLAHCQIIFPIFSRGLDLPSTIWRAALTLLGCWVIIILALISRFQQNDHPIILDVVAHVKISVYPFQVALHDTHVMLSKVVRSHVLLFENLMMQSHPQMQYAFMDQLHK